MTHQYKSYQWQWKCGCSRSSMWLRRSSLRSSTDRWLPAIFLPGSRRRFSPLLWRSWASTSQTFVRIDWFRTCLCCWSYSNASLLANWGIVQRPLIFYRLLQSSFRPGHSTETAVLQVLSDILQAVNCVRSATRCQQPRSNNWWLLCCYPDLTTETAYWSVFQYTWSISSRCRTLPHDWFVDFDASIMYQMRCSACTGWVSWSASSTRSPC